MSILDKHPAPWRGWDDKHDFTVVDAAGVEVFPLQLIISREAPDELKRLILAAPELLSALKTCPWLPRNETRLPNGMIVPGDYKKTSAWLDAAEALIARIEGGK